MTRARQDVGEQMIPTAVATELDARVMYAILPRTVPLALPVVARAI
jgi:hypothetical protein